jgi:hypothetical protein
VCDFKSIILGNYEWYRILDSWNGFADTELIIIPDKKDVDDEIILKRYDHFKSWLESKGKEVMTGSIDSQSLKNRVSKYWFMKGKQEANKILCLEYVKNS